MLSRHSHAPRRRREGGPCVVSWCAVQPPAAACLAAWRPGSLLQRTPRRPRRGRAPCCTGLPACTSARRRNVQGRNRGWRGQAASASKRAAAASRSSASLDVSAATDRLASEHPQAPRNIAAQALGAAARTLGARSRRRRIPASRPRSGRNWLDPRPIYLNSTL